MIKFIVGVMVGVYYSDEIIQYVGQPLAQMMLATGYKPPYLRKHS